MRSDKKGEDQIPLHDPNIDLELEARVDAMMDPYYEPRPEAVEPVVESALPEKSERSDQSTLPPIDIFNEAQTAPEVPAELAKELTTADQAVAEAEDTPAPEKVIVIADSAAEETPPAAGGSDGNIDDPATDKVVDDITEHEDESLEGEDKAVRPVYVADTRSRSHKFGAFFGKPAVRWALFLLLVLLPIAGGLWPTSRYFVLNAAGVQSSASVTVIDTKSGQPLKNATVTLGESSARTNERGVAQLSRVALGTQQLIIERVAYATKQRSVTIGWGSNPLGKQELKPTGAQYVFSVSDYISRKPISGVEAVNGEASAFANKEGVIELVLEDPSETLDITIRKSGYREEVLTFPATDMKKREVKLVPDRPIVFAHDGEGTMALYRSDVDGKNRRQLVADIGDEYPLPGNILVSQDGSWAALVSKRDRNRTDEKGLALDTVSVINLKDNKVRSIDHAVAANLLTWRGSQLVYSATYGSSGEAASSDQRIVGYDIENDARSLLLSAREIRDTMLVQNYLYYILVDAEGKTQFARMKADGSNKLVLREATDDGFESLQRIEGSLIQITTPDDDIAFHIDNESFVEADELSDGSRFVDNTDSRSAWVVPKDGRQAVMVYNYKTGQNDQLALLEGEVRPLEWINETTLLVYVQSFEASAIYAMSVEGGVPQKVADAGLQVDTPVSID